MTRPKDFLMPSWMGFRPPFFDEAPSSTSSMRPRSMSWLTWFVTVDLSRPRRSAMPTRLMRGWRQIVRKILAAVVVPGALPFVFTGLQISIGVAWFSLVAAEMVSGDYGLGYLINSSYVNSVTIPMVIGMLTLGFVGWVTSAIVRWAGNRLMQWHVRALALQGR